MPVWRLCSWNVNGLRAAARKGFVDWLKAESPHVLCVQETKAELSQLSQDVVNVPGYEAQFFSAEKKGYSGVGTYSRLTPEKVERGFDMPKYDREGRVLVHHFPEFVLFNIYFPNGKQSPERLEYKMRFYEDFLKIIRNYRKRGHKRIVVCGDVNTAHREIDLARPKENSKISGFLPEERAWIDRFLAENFVDTFRVYEKGPGHYTWWDMQTRARERNVGWRIDYFFVSESLVPHLKKSNIRSEILGSDHCPIELELEF